MDTVHSNKRNSGVALQRFVGRRLVCHRRANHFSAAICRIHRFLQRDRLTFWLQQSGAVFSFAIYPFSLDFFRTTNSRCKEMVISAKGPICSKPIVHFSDGCFSTYSSQNRVLPIHLWTIRTYTRYSSPNFASKYLSLGTISTIQHSIALGKSRISSQVKLAINPTPRRKATAPR